MHIIIFFVILISALIGGFIYGAFIGTKLGQALVPPYIAIPLIILYGLVFTAVLLAITYFAPF